MLALIAAVTGLLVDPTVVLYATVAIYRIMIRYFLVHTRHHLVAHAPEEEFALIRQAKAELARDDVNDMARQRASTDAT